MLCVDCLLFVCVNYFTIRCKEREGDNHCNKRAMIFVSQCLIFVVVSQLWLSRKMPRQMLFARALVDGGKVFTIYVNTYFMYMYKGTHETSQNGEQKRNGRGDNAEVKEREILLLFDRLRLHCATSLCGNFSSIASERLRIIQQCYNIFILRSNSFVKNILRSCNAGQIQRTSSKHQRDNKDVKALSAQSPHPRLTKFGSIQH